MTKLSKAEQDRRRRQGKQPLDPSKRNLYLAIGAVVVAGLVIWAVVGDSGTPTGREANIAAFGLEDDPYLGDPEAAVVVVGFEAPRCSACRGFHAQVLPELKAQHFDTGNAVFYYNQFRISNEDFDIGIMQECALRHVGNEGFWDFTDKVYLELGQYPSIGAAEQKFQEFGQATGLGSELDSCYTGKETASKVSADWRVGEQWDVRGTPTFYVFADGEAFRVTSGGIASAIEELIGRGTDDA